MPKNIGKAKRKQLEQQLAEQELLLQEVMTKQKNNKISLRFGQTCVSASSIAEQYFCEKKVEMQYIHGKVETESKQLGTEGHEMLLADTVKVKRVELFERIWSGERVIVHEMLLLSRCRDLILVGRPDAIVFSKAMPLFLFEYKFSRSPTPFNSYHVQAKVYGKILEGMGFDTSKLHYVLAVAPPSLKNDTALFRKILNASVRNGPKEARLEMEEANVHIHPYRSADADQAVFWASGFWKEVREAIPTNNPNKCRSCEYKNNCIS
jgi:hypothetical protein